MTRPAIAKLEIAARVLKLFVERRITHVLCVLVLYKSGGEMGDSRSLEKMRRLLRECHYIHVFKGGIEGFSSNRGIYVLVC